MIESEVKGDELTRWMMLEQEKRLYEKSLTISQVNIKELIEEEKAEVKLLTNVSCSILAQLKRKDNARVVLLASLLWRGYSEGEAVEIIKKTEASLEK